MKVSNRAKPKKQNNLKQIDPKNEASADGHRKNCLITFSSKRIERAAENKLSVKYEELYAALRNHLESFQAASMKMQAINDRYYTEIAKMVEEERIFMNSILNDQSKAFIKELENHMRQVGHKINEIRCGKTRKEDLQEFNMLSKICTPTFHIQKGKIQDLGNLLITLRPSYQAPTDPPKQIPSQFSLHLKDEVSEQLSEPSTVKKEPSGRGDFFSCLDLMCEQELAWDQLRKQGKKHEVVSEIIFQEPSSCQDSLLSNELL